MSLYARAPLIPLDQRRQSDTAATVFTNSARYRAAIDPTYLYQENASEERALWRAVVAQAFVDSGWQDPRPTDKLTRDNIDITRRRMSVAKHQAIVWLRGNSKDFEEVCEMADIPAGLVRSSAEARRALGWPPAPREESHAA